MVTKKREKLNKLSNKFRFSIFNDTTHEEIFIFRSNGLLFILTILLAIVFLIASVTMIISYTSLREMIPGYPSAESRRQLIQNSLKLDPLQNEINIRRLQLANIQRVAVGKIPIQIDSILNIAQSKDSTIDYSMYLKDDSLLRATVLKEEQFNLVGRHKIESIEGLHIFPPLKVFLTADFNQAIHHTYVDIAAPSYSALSSILHCHFIYS